MVYFRTAMNFLLHPAQAFESARGKKTKDAFITLLALLAFLSLLTAALQLFLGPGELFITTFLTTFVVGLLLNLLLGCWIHFWAYLLGARGVESTLKAVFYSATPAALFGWLGILPEAGRFLSLAFLLWTILLTWMGMKKLHHPLSGRRAAAVILLSYGLGFAILLGLALFTISTFLPLLFAFRGEI